MVRTSDLEGKLMSLSVTMEEMLVTILHTDALGPLTVELKQMKFKQFYTKLPNSPNVCRTLECSLSSIRWKDNDAIILGI
jgi:hypothetical protein